MSEQPFLNAFLDLVNDPFKVYMDLSAKLGDLVKQHSILVEKAINEQYQFLQLTANHSEPNENTLKNLLSKTSECITSILDFREKNRSSKWFDHLSAISESIPALGWVTVSPTPAPFVKEMIDSSKFYSNKVLVAYKEKDKTHLEWVKSWTNFLTNLHQYIKTYHTTGLKWNSKGLPATENSVNSSGPLPPPPPPSDFFSNSHAVVDDARSALLRDLNQGTDITRGLKKITADQQTHKNPSLRTQGPVPFKASTQNKASTKPVVSSIKPPRHELEGKKWMIEYQVGNRQLVVNVQEMNQSVVIYKCKDCLIVVKGKANSVTLDTCIKTSITFDSIVSVVEIINSQSIQAQSMSTVPTINVEKTDNVEIYLNEKSMNAEIVTAKSSAVNVSVPSGDGDYIEYPIPEQFKSTWTGKGFKTVPADKAA